MNNENSDLSSKKRWVVRGGVVTSIASRKFSIQSNKKTPPQKSIMRKTNSKVGENRFR